jgi:hypothetical protein
MSVLRSDVDADLPRDTPEMPEDDGPLSIERMVISIKLINYLEDFMLEIQLLRKRDRKELSSILARLAEMKTELTNWWTSIPESAFNVDRTLDGQAFRSCMHLRLLYCLIRMFIGRPFLFTGGRLHEESPSSPPDTRKTHSQTDHPTKARENSTTSTIDGKRRPSRRLALVQATIDAAVEALDLCAMLYEGNEGLARASYIEYSSCRASMLALIAYSIQEQTDQYRSIMQKGLEMSREMSAAGESARAESTLIEALERAVARLQMFGPGWQQRRESRAGLGGVQQGGVGGSQGHGLPYPQRQISNYDQFKHWQHNWKQSGGGSASGSTANSGRGTPAATSMPPPNYQPTSSAQQNSTNPGLSMDHTNSSIFSDAPQHQSSPYNGSDATPTAGYVMPNSAPSIISDGSGTAGTGVNANDGVGGGMDMFGTYNPSAAAEAAFFQTLSGMPDVTPSASAVNGWLTQARPERQVLDHFLAMPEGEWDALAFGAGAGDGGFGGAGGSGGEAGSAGQGSGHGLYMDGSAGSGGGGDGGLSATNWYDLPGTGTGGGGQLPGFGGW